MHCDIYKFSKHEDLYVYIARPDYPHDTEELRDWLGVLPSDFRKTLGTSSFVMHLDLEAKDKLARADINEVKQKLVDQGYFVQLPPQDIMARNAMNKAKAAQDKKYD